MPSVEEAYVEATAAARDMWPELLTSLINPLFCAFEISDENGALLFRLPFAELIENCRIPRASTSRHIAVELTRAIARAQEAKNGLTQEVGQARRHLAEASQIIDKLNLLERLGQRSVS